MKAYELLHPMPGLQAGAVFVHDKKNKSGRGSIGCGCLILSWIDGDCNSGWCGGTFTLPGQMAENSFWFREIPNPKVEQGRGGYHNKRRYYINISTSTCTKVS